MYYNGQRGIQAYEQIAWEQSKGNSRAQQSIGCMYERGKDITQNYELAFPGIARIHHLLLIEINAKDLSSRNTLLLLAAIFSGWPYSHYLAVLPSPIKKTGAMPI